MATTLTSKGQVTIPKEIRQALGIGPGSAVTFTLANDGRVVVNKAPDRDFTAKIEKWRGSAGLGQSTDEIMAMSRGEP